MRCSYMRKPEAATDQISETNLASQAPLTGLRSHAKPKELASTGIVFSLLALLTVLLLVLTVYLVAAHKLP